LLICPLKTDIMATFNMSYPQWGLINSGALVLGTLLYPLWGWLSDKYNRAKLLAAASFIWGSTTWLNAIAPNYNFFLVTRASTGIDDSSYPGLFSLVADYFPPKVRGKVYGVLQLAQPLGYLVGMLLALMLGGVIGWRNIFFITGTLGILLAVAIFFGVKEAPRGQSEPELEGIDQTGRFKFSWKEVGELFKKKSMILIFVQGFFGVFPWNVIVYFFFLYLTNERGYSDNTNLIIMGTAVIVLAAGYPIGGMLGDWLFKRTLKGRAIVGAGGVIIGALLLYATLSVPVENQWLFMALLCATALFIPFASPNVLATVYDVTLPEIRSTAQAVEYFIESAGAAAAPLLTGIIADQLSIREAMLIICLSAWALCGVFFIAAPFVIPGDVRTLRAQLRARADAEKKAASQPAG
jgi:MFS family permease